jgi:hypothetical protein
MKGNPPYYYGVIGQPNPVIEPGGTETPAVAKDAKLKIIKF